MRRVCGAGGSECGQVQGHGKTIGGQRWYMPSLNFYATPLPGLNLEVVSLDTNVLDHRKTYARQGRTWGALPHRAHLPLGGAVHC